MFCKMFSVSSQAVGIYCTCCAAQASKGNFETTFYETFFTTWRPRLQYLISASGWLKPGDSIIALRLDGVSKSLPCQTCLSRTQGDEGGFIYSFIVKLDLQYFLKIPLTHLFCVSSLLTERSVSCPVPQSSPYVRTLKSASVPRGLEPIV